MLRKLFPKTDANYRELDDDLVTPRRGNPLPFDRFSQLLPYTGYDRNNELFVIAAPSADPGATEGFGFTIEMSPQLGADREMAANLVNLFKVGLPENAGIQVQMFGSPVLDHQLDAALACTVGSPQAPEGQIPLLRKMCERRNAFYRKGTREELHPNTNFRMRDFRANLSVVIPAKSLKDEMARRNAVTARQSVINTLAQYYLYGHTWDPEDLINWCALLLNPQRTLAGDHRWLSYDPGRALRDQIVAADTAAAETSDGILYTGGGAPPVGMRAMSVRSYRKRLTLAHMGALLGSATSDAVSYPCPFLITFGCSIPNVEGEKQKTQLLAARAQQKADSPLAKWMPRLHDVNADWKLAQAAFDRGSSTLKVYHQLLLFAPPEELANAEQSARSIWRTINCELVVDSKMQKQALLSALPMMYGPLLQGDLRKTGRCTTKTMENAANMMPVLAEWTGTDPRKVNGIQQAVLTLFGRRGQIMGIDIFANPSGNYNGIVVGKSGSGKSNFLNELLQRTLAVGGRAWVVDVGGSYEKLAGTLGGQYIRFTNDSGLSVNPFWMVNTEELDEQQEDLQMVHLAVAQMISPSRPLTDYEDRQLRIAIDQLWLDHGKYATVTQLAEYLKKNCANGGSTETTGYGGEADPALCDPRIRDMGVQLYPFTEDGPYGRFFHGPANVRFDANLIVLELEELASRPDLQAVVMMMLMYRITQGMYLARRDQPKLAVIDEAWDLMSSGNSGAFIEKGYRRARKYGGGFFTATQSIADYYKSDTARAAFENADWMFLLSQKAESINQLIKSDKLELDEYTKGLLKSLKTIHGKYAEIFVKAGDLPPAVGRLYLDPYSLVTFSTQPADFQAVRDLRAQGMSTDEAIEAVLATREAAGQALYVPPAFDEEDEYLEEMQ